MKIYMDVCCFNRPFDNDAQSRIHLEAEAVLSILGRCENGEWMLSASDVIDLELSKMNDKDRLEKVRALYSIAKNRVALTSQAIERSSFFQKQGIKLFDSLHLAVAETSGQTVLLTTDDKFLRKATTFELTTSVANPVTWLMEVLK